jgi:hypothetical protein
MVQNCKQDSSVHRMNATITAAGWAIAPPMVCHVIVTILAIAYPVTVVRHGHHHLPLALAYALPVTVHPATTKARVIHPLEVMYAYVMTPITTGRLRCAPLSILVASWHLGTAASLENRTTTALGWVPAIRLEDFVCAMMLVTAGDLSAVCCGMRLQTHLHPPKEASAHS